MRSSKEEKKNIVNTTLKECDCRDFPRVRLCKHLAAVQHYFGGAPLAPSHSSSPPNPTALELPLSQGTNPVAAYLSALDEVIVLSRHLMTQVLTPEKVKSIRGIIAHLNAISTSTTNGERLPEKDMIAPHRLTWPETSHHMGVRRGQKRGKVDSALTAELMGEPNRKRNHMDGDPYGAGEQSGKRVKLDARSVAANAKARASTQRHASSATQWGVPSPTQPNALGNNLVQGAPLYHPPLSQPAPLPFSLSQPVPTPFFLSQPTPSSASYVSQPYVQFPAYAMPYHPMYYPPPTR